MSMAAGPQLGPAAVSSVGGPQWREVVMSLRMRTRFLIASMVMAMLVMAVATVILAGNVASQPSWPLAGVASVWLVSLFVIVEARLTIMRRRRRLTAR